MHIMRHTGTAQVGCYVSLVWNVTLHANWFCNTAQHRRAVWETSSMTEGCNRIPAKKQLASASSQCCMDLCWGLACMLSLLGQAVSRLHRRKLVCCILSWSWDQPRHTLLHPWGRVCTAWVQQMQHSYLTAELRPRVWCAELCNCITESTPVFIATVLRTDTTKVRSMPRRRLTQNTGRRPIDMRHLRTLR